MRRLTLSVGVLFAASLTGTEWREIRDYLGEMGANEAIGMSLSNNGPSYTGTYFRKRDLRDVPVEGKLDGRDLTLRAADGVFHLAFAPTDPKGAFKGPLKEEVLAGFWMSNGAREKLPVYLAMTASRPVQQGEKRYEVTGAKDPALLERNAQAFYYAVLKNDRAAAARHVAYPLTYQANGKRRRARNAAEFLQAWDTIFTPAFLARFAQGIPHNMFARDQGAMLGSGEVWFNDRGFASSLNNF